MNNQLSLVILAVGLDSRYKVPAALQVVGPQKEMLIEYTIFDALKAGIKHFVFIIDQDFKDEIRRFLKKLIESKNCSVEFILQTTFTSVSRNYFDIMLDRQLSWGTAHALLVAKNHLVNPFIVINYEDYYGQEAFKKSIRLNSGARISPYRFGTIAYPIDQTLYNAESSNRFCCRVERQILKSLDFYENISRFEDKVVFNEEHISGIIENDTPTNVGLWIFHPSIFKIIEDKFDHFMKTQGKNKKAQFQLDQMMQELVLDKIVEIEVVNIDNNWFSLITLDDRDVMNEYLKVKIEAGNYPLKLWN